MSRDYVFTAWSIPVFDESNCRYICWGEEVCPTTGKKHWQGFAIFNRTCRMPKAKAWIGAGNDIHLETRKGSRVEARNYSIKDNKFSEWGLFEGRTTKDIFKLNINDIKIEYPEFYCRYHRGLEKLNIDMGLVWRDVEVHWLWGPAGCGKTRSVIDKKDVFKIDELMWWDGYNKENIILIDDVDYESFEKRRFMLNLLDGYRLRLSVKGGFVYAHWLVVYITSNWNPERLLLRDDAFERRVTSVTELG